MGSHDPVGTRRVGARHYSDKSRRLADNRIASCIDDIQGFVVTVGYIGFLKDRIEPTDGSSSHLDEPMDNPHWPPAAQALAGPEDFPSGYNG